MSTNRNHSSQKRTLLILLGILLAFLLTLNMKAFHISESFVPNDKFDPMESTDVKGRILEKGAEIVNEVSKKISYLK